MTSEIIESRFGNKLRVRVNGILIENGCLLLVKHKGLGKNGYLWAPPGGGMEFGTSAPDNLKREFLEETGIDVEVKGLLFTYEFLNLPLHAIELFFHVIRRGGNIKKGIDPELEANDQIIEEVKFFALRDLLDIPKPALHKSLHNLKQVEDIMQKQGYFKS